MDKLDLSEIFSLNGYIGKSLPVFEDRPQQLQMAQEIQKLVESSVDKHQILIVEAGTGIGKSLAYLVPFIYWSVSENKKVVISTYTKTLQEQLTNKDLPYLEKALPVEFKFALCVGSENYICRRRYKQAHQYNLFSTKSEASQFNRISKWLKETETGLRLELDFEPEDRLWLNICRESDLCIGRKCLHYDDCFYIKSRSEQNKANILVVNHYLFFTNIASAGKVLPQYDAIVFDEAQNIEEVAGQYLGIEISNTGMNYLLNRIYNPATGKGLLARTEELSSDTRKDIIRFIDDVRHNSDTFFTSIVDKFGSETITKRIHTPDFFENRLDVPLSNLYQGLKSCLTEIETEEKMYEFSAYANRCLALQTGLKIFVEQKLQDYVYWIEILPRMKYLKIMLNVTPINVSNILKEKVYDVTSPIVLTSATLATNKSFDYIKERLGLNESSEATSSDHTNACLEAILDSPFDYKKNVLLYIPDHLPDPSYEFDKFQTQAIQHLKEIIEIFKGRTFILFTSYKAINQANEFLGENLTDVILLKQGDMPRWQMIEHFKLNSNAVLLGTNTFWQGVDIPGKALECVIIFKLPFSVPDDPVTEAKIEYLVKQNKDPFMHYQIPQAILMLKQGFGRLIRTKTDRGVVAILDPRIKTRYYGRLFIESLPKCSLTNQVSDVKC